MPARFWAELPADTFADGALADAIAVIPLGATEQHGPHLPICTDSSLACGLVDASVPLISDDTNVLVLPVMEITNSTEHTNAPGTLSLGRDLTMAMIIEVARSVCRAGVRKLVIINAHGGNVGVMVDASHAIRAELGMLCVATNWMRLGLPDGVISAEDRAVDIHAGQLETAMMLALQPDLVDQSKAQTFSSLQRELEQRYSLLRAYGPVGFGWMGTDLNAAGAQGDATAATAEDGQAIINYQARQMAKLLAEVDDFTPAWF